ncbi:protein lethal(2)essential for life-like [Cydia strobilella]|uniref:protein lethal(2)essential for life-like n=1 Tax=Cydia strobilella TaxID=1100964 RepID=UPI003005ACDC
MSLLPYFFDDWNVRPRYHHHHYPSRLHDQHFGLALNPDDLLAAVAGPVLSREYYRPWRHLAAAAKDIGSSIKADKDKYQINLDVQHFAPEEISVKTADGYIVVEGKHEEKKDDHGYISRQFTRRYALPEGTAPETVESKLSSDGVLSIVAPRKVPDAIKGERSVPVTQTGPIRKEIKDQSEGTNEKEAK